MVRFRAVSLFVESYVVVKVSLSSQKEENPNRVELALTINSWSWVGKS